LTTSHGSAAVFSSNQYNNLVSTIVLDDVLTTVYAAVEGSAIGNTIVQLYPAAHFPSSVENYTISMAKNCALSISCFGANIEKGISHTIIRETITFVVFIFTNWFLVCAGSLAVLTNRFSQTRGSQCTNLALFVVPVIVPVSSSTKSSTTVRPTSTTSSSYTTTTTTTTSTTATAIAISSPAVSSASVSPASTTTASSSPVSSSSAVPSCSLPPYFTITVNETGMPPQYLYDPFSVDDEALSFTTDFSQGLIFSLNATGQLEFTISDIYNNVVQLISEQDIQVCYH
jgi:hypothetical protein